MASDTVITWTMVKKMAPAIAIIAAIISVISFALTTAQIAEANQIDIEEIYTQLEIEKQSAENLRIQNAEILQKLKNIEQISSENREGIKEVRNDIKGLIRGD